MVVSPTIVETCGRQGPVGAETVPPVRQSRREGRGYWIAAPGYYATTCVLWLHMLMSADISAGALETATCSGGDWRVFA